MRGAGESQLIDLQCPECGQHYSAEVLQTYCLPCRSPLTANYDLETVGRKVNREEVGARPRGLWRWAELLPVRQPEHRLTLGEGDTPFLPLPRLGQEFGLADLWVKDESSNPTGSFKARGLAVAMSRAVELGARAFVIPTAGNAGGALAAYAARANVEAHVYMPADAPRANQLEVMAAGAVLHLVNGLINEAARLAGIEAGWNGWFDVSTFKEPYRLEGKKTLGFELAENLGWRLPDAILYPTGGGTGLVGMWKAFAEMEALGWIGSARPRLISIQAEGCAPVVKAFSTGAERAEVWPDAHTLAAGLRVPAVFADRLILRALHQSQGHALSVSDAEILSAQRLCGRLEGIFAAPEGAAVVAALPHLLNRGWLHPGEKVVIFNTGSGLKYL